MEHKIPADERIYQPVCLYQLLAVMFEYPSKIDASLPYDPTIRSPMTAAAVATLQVATEPLAGAPTGPAGGFRDWMIGPTGKLNPA